MQKSFYIIVFAATILSLQLKSCEVPPITSQNVINVIIEDTHYIVTQENAGNDLNKAGTQITFDQFKEKLQLSFFKTLFLGKIQHKYTFSTKTRYNIDEIHEKIGSVPATYLQQNNIIKKEDPEANENSSSLNLDTLFQKNLQYYDLEALELFFKFQKSNNSLQEGHQFAEEVTVYKRNYTRPLLLLATTTVAALTALVWGITKHSTKK